MNKGFCIKHLFFLPVICVLLSLGELNAQTSVATFVNYQTAEVPKRIARKFRRDAARLALRQNGSGEDLRYQNIEIPQQSSASFYKLLTNIYQNDSVARSIANCNIHTFPYPPIESFTVIFDRHVEWAQLLHEGINEITSVQMNSYIEKYQLVIEKYVQWNDWQDAITIRSRKPLNMAALANEFYNIEGVEEIDLGIPEVSGNDVRVKRIKDGWEVEYILVFGNFLNGQGQRHSWIFHIYDTNRVKFISESGHPVPDWMRCEGEIFEMFATF